MALDATPLSNAVRRLREGPARHQWEPNDEQLRDGLIQRLECTYELHRMRHVRDIRTLTTHTQDADTASAVVQEIPAFIEEAEYLCAELQRRLS